MSNPIILNKRHFDNLQTRDNLIKDLQHELAQARAALRNRDVFDNFLAHALGGACGNSHLMKLTDKGDEQWQIASTVAIGAANRLMDDLNKMAAAAEEAQKIEAEKNEIQPVEPSEPVVPSGPELVENPPSQS